MQLLSSFSLACLAHALALHPSADRFLPWHKLGVWTLTDYDVAIFMDADMMALHDPHELFDHLEASPRADYGATAYACGSSARMTPDHLGDWTSGIIICHPNVTIYKLLVDAVATPSIWGSNIWIADGTPARSSDSLYRNDQRFLGEFFLDPERVMQHGLHSRWIDPYVFHANPVSCR